MGKKRRKKVRRMKTYRDILLEEAEIKPIRPVWDSGLKVTRTVQIYVPFKVLSIVRAIEDRIPGNYEFSVLFKAHREGNKIYVEPEYYIPRQEVSYASIKYKEDLKALRDQGYRVVVHKHPDNITDFSGTDDEHINAHFDASILYVGRGFQKAVARAWLDEETIVLVPRS